ncbi:helix-turn-helix domain-containing protein [Streptomyces sp. NPDC007264]|uniref:helix-turn-helix domain-containing protein n=1 Tax=Streptomyces sp. NPDC007264 TaxID=3364777 RepID=UPI0036DD1043
MRQLVVQLRRVKDHSGLSLEALAARTGYSRSSWDRYLNGRAIPPQQAVAALARACDTDPARLLALHEVAAEAGEGAGAGPRQAAAAETAGPAEDGGGDGDNGSGDGDGGVPGRNRGRWVLASVAAAIAAGLIALVVAAPWDDGGTGKDRTAPVSASTAEAQGKGAFVFRAGKDYPCTVRRDKDGLLYAGYSRTRTDLIGSGSAQWAVVEAQCLLGHHGLSPGIADGAYGTHTERAVKRLQERAHLSVDGVIGEDTWGVLRK